MASFVGTLAVFSVEWIRNPPQNKSQMFRQPGKDGEQHVRGKLRTDASTLRATIFSVSPISGQTALSNAAALVGTTLTVREDSASVGPLDTPGVFIESVKPTKMNACVGPGNTSYVTILEFTVYLPFDW